MSGRRARGTLVRAFQAAIPDEAALMACRAIGCGSPLRLIDLSAAEVLRRAPESDLGDPERLEQLLPDLGLNGDLPGLFPERLQDKLDRGLSFWQYPCQLAPFLAYLSRLPLRSYLEVGVMHGGTFVVLVEYLKRMTGLQRAWAVDVMRVPSLRRYARQQPGVRVLRENSQSERFRAALQRSGGFDLAFIDGDHAYDAVRRDFELIRPHAQVIVFHDIVDAAWPGVRRFWSEVQDHYAETHHFEQFTAQYPEIRAVHGQDYLGIGVMVPRSMQFASASGSAG